MHNFSRTFAFVCCQDAGAQLFKTILPMYIARNPDAQVFNNILRMNVARNPRAQLFKNILHLLCCQEFFCTTFQEYFTHVLCQEPSYTHFQEYFTFVCCQELWCTTFQEYFTDVCCQGSWCMTFPEKFYEQCMLPCCSTFQKKFYQFIWPGTLMHNFTRLAFPLHVLQTLSAQPYKYIFTSACCQDPVAQLLKNIFTSVQYIVRAPVHNFSRIYSLVCASCAQLFVPPLPHLSPSCIKAQ